MTHTLTHGPYTLVVDPALGGAVRKFSFDGHDILRPCPDSAPGSVPGSVKVLDSSAFPMVPYSGRVADARFDWRGVTVKLPRNFPPEPHAIHGTGWHAEWEVEEAAEMRLVLSHSPALAEWPWACTARMEFTLGKDGLELTMSVTNDSSKGSAKDTIKDSGRDMPAGLGWHPYFVRGDAELSVATTHMWANDEDGVSARKVAPPDGLDGSRPRTVSELGLDNAFDVEVVDATISWPSSGLSARLAADETFRNIVIYTPDNIPPGPGHFCVEPASHAPDALNTHPPASSGMDVLAPGETLSGRIRLAVTKT